MERCPLACTACFSWSSTSFLPPCLVPPGPPSPSPAPSPAPADGKDSEKSHDEEVKNKIHKEYAAALDHEGIHKTHTLKG